jgi:acyl carrier protein
LRLYFGEPSRCDSGVVGLCLGRCGRYNSYPKLTQLHEANPAMDETQIYHRLTALFQDVFDEDSIKLTPGLSAKDVDGWDSLTHIRLMLTVEKAFKIKFSTAEISKLENVGDLVTLIKAKI